MDESPKKILKPVAQLPKPKYSTPYYFMDQLNQIAEFNQSSIRY